jgi:hypothetical protein
MCLGGGGILGLHDLRIVPLQPGWREYKAHTYFKKNFNYQFKGLNINWDVHIFQATYELCLWTYWFFFLQKLETSAHDIPAQHLLASGKIANLDKIQNLTVTFSVPTQKPPPTNREAIRLWITFI